MSGSLLDPTAHAAEQVAHHPRVVPVPAPEASAVDLADWYRARFTRFPPSAKQLAVWERLVREHQRGLTDPTDCRVCGVVFPCLPRIDAQAALAAARGDLAQSDEDPLVRMSARVAAVRRAEEGLTALLQPLLAEARTVAATHRPDARGWCPVCGDPARVGDARVVWPCGMYKFAATVLRRNGQPRPAPDQAR
jgi:hypothetical protein